MALSTERGGIIIVRLHNTKVLAEHMPEHDESSVCARARSSVQLGQATGDWKRCIGTSFHAGWHPQTDTQRVNPPVALHREMPGRGGGGEPGQGRTVEPPTIDDPLPTWPGSHTLRCLVMLPGRKWSIWPPPAPRGFAVRGRPMPDFPDGKHLSNLK